MKLVVSMLVLAVGCAALCSESATAQSDPATQFSGPTRLKAGDAFLGERRMFPSPVFHDMNGDGLQDIVVGDLVGKLTVALRKPGAGPASYGEETKLLAADGKEIDFHNW
jgi:hypothetical protein